MADAAGAVQLRLCVQADAPTLAVIAAATMLETYAGWISGRALLAHCGKHHVPSAYEAILRQPETRAWLAEVNPDAAPIGYTMLTAPDFPEELVRADDLELRRIYLFSRFHRAGIGGRMLEAALAGAREQGAKRVLLGVHPENHRALAFYRRNGFQAVGQRQFQVGTSVFQDPVLALEL